MGIWGSVPRIEKSEEFTLFGLGSRRRSAITGILDTSVIIDGRIADIADTGFLEGNLMVRASFSTNCSTSPTPRIP